MATKSFTTDLTFNQKSANSLIHALSSRSKVERHVPADVEDVEMVKDSFVIKKMFIKE